MWSDKYYYLNIAHDLDLSVRFSTVDLINFLHGQKELRQESNFRFGNSALLPTFLDIQLLRARSYNNWSDRDTDSQETNLLAIVSAKGENVDFEKVKGLLIRIATFLRWQLIDEETDEGEENFVLWSPSGDCG
jgi:hypothetical protein